MTDAVNPHCEVRPGTHCAHRGISKQTRFDSYQRFPRPPPPPPPPPPRLYPPPPPPPPNPRSGLGRASFTFNARPSSSLPLSAAIALSASALTLISTNPNPRACPVSRSVIRFTRSTVPYCSNSVRIASSVVPKLRFPTKMFFIVSLV